MPLKLNTPASNGRVFEASYDGIENGAVHLAVLRQPGLGDSIIDAFIALERGNPKWRASIQTIVTKRSEMRDFLLQHAPDIVIVSGTSINAYSFHPRRQSLSQFISKYFIDLWLFAEENSEKKLGLTALLWSSIDHEMGHLV